MLRIRCLVILSKKRPQHQFLQEKLNQESSQSSHPNSEFRLTSIWRLRAVCCLLKRWGTNSTTTLLKNALSLLLLLLLFFFLCLFSGMFLFLVDVICIAGYCLQPWLSYIVFFFLSLAIHYFSYDPS